MIQCPKCKNDTPDDSWHCDQCGEKLMFCPKCSDGKPRRGKRCTQCGTLLVSGEDITKQPESATKIPPKAPESTSEKETWSMDDVFTQFGNIFGKQAQQSTQHPVSQPPDDFDIVEKDTIFGRMQVKQPKQHPSSQSPGSQSGGTMRGPSQQTGTQRTPTGPQMQLDAPSRLVMVDDPSKTVVLKANAIIGRTTGDYLDVFGSCGYVSGRHAKIVLHKDGNWLYCDLGSTNGSKIYSTTLEPNKHYILKKGMTMEIGTVKFKVE